MTRRPSPEPATTAGRTLLATLALAGAMVAVQRGVPVPVDPPGGEAWASWLAAQDPAALVAGGLRMAALVLGWYLVAALATGWACHVVGWKRGAELAEAATPRFARRLVRASLGLSLLVGPLGPSPAGAESPAAGATAEAPIAMRRAVDATAPQEGGSGDITMRRLPEAPAGGPLLVAPAPPVAQRWTITPGQHLWEVAERTVSAAVGGPATDAQVDPYWRRLIEANRHRLADPHHPDLVFPGQVFDLPPVPPADV